MITSIRRIAVHHCLGKMQCYYGDDRELRVPPREWIDISFQKESIVYECNESLPQEGYMARNWHECATVLVPRVSKFFGTNSSFLGGRIDEIPKFLNTVHKDYYWSVA